MTSVLDRATARGIGGSPSAMVTGVWAAVRAAAASLALVLLPVVAAWGVAGTSVTWAQAVRVGLDAWLLAHRGGIGVDGGHIGITPLGLTGLVAASCWFAAARMVRGLDPHAAAIRAGVQRHAPAEAPAPALAGFVAGYAAVGAVLAVATGTGTSRPVFLQAVLGCAALAGLTVTAASLGHAGGGARGGLRRAFDRVRMPPPVRRWGPPAALALAVLMVLATLLLLLAVVTSWPQILALQRGLHPGAVGGIALAVAQLALLPNLAVWAAAFCAGPGFALGAGTSVTPALVSLGPLPALPVLGALPAPGEQPGWLRLVIAVPLLAGVAAGWLAVRRRPQDPVSEAMLDGIGAAVLAAAGFVVLAWLAGGPVGPGRLAVTGPHPLAASGMLAVELGLGALGGGLVARGLDGAWARLRRRPAG